MEVIYTRRLRLASDKILNTILHMRSDQKLPIHGQHTTVFDLADFGLPEVPLLGIHNQQRARQGLMPHLHDGAMEICYLVKGEIVFTVEGRDYPLKGNDVFWTHPDETHGSGYHAYEKCLLYWLQITIPLRPHAFLGMSGPAGWPLAKALRTLPARQFRGYKTLKALFENAFLLCQQPPTPFQRIELAALLAQWLVRVVACACQEETLTRSADIQHALDFIENQLPEVVSVGVLAKVAGLSESRFKTKFRDQLGIPPSEYVMRKRILRAKKLLETSDQTITDIAHSLGFSSSQYFANVFRRFLLVKPSTARNVT